LTFAALEAGIDLANEEEVLRVQTTMNYEASEDPSDQYFSVDGLDVTEAIRGAEVSQSVSAIAAHPAVRAGLVAHFRDVIARCENPGIVMEGRDITTVVAPDAPVRILLTASEEIRIARRQAELDGVVAAPQVGEALMARDRSDQSVVDFMNAAAGVTLLDSTPLTFEQTIQAMIALIAQHQGE
jgi:cytidylate kinase